MENVKLNFKYWKLNTQELEYLGFDLTDAEAVDYPNHKFFSLEFTKDIIMYPKDGVYDEYNLKSILRYGMVNGKNIETMFFDVYCESDSSKKGSLNVKSVFEEPQFTNDYSFEDDDCEDTSEDWEDILHFHLDFSLLVERVGTMMELVPVDYWHNDWREYCRGLAELHGKLTGKTSDKYKERNERYLDVMDLVMKEAKGEIVK